jgi:uncharacterized membrane protein YedE/YeeE
MSAATSSGGVRAGVAMAAASGLLFGLGLVASGMTDPRKVIGFLDVAGGAWNPSLAFVMVGAIGVHAVGLRLLARRARPRWAEAFAAPPAARLDARLLGGAALFGVGWGLGGVCPGPALVAGVWSSSAGLFAAGLLVGIAVQGRLASPSTAPPTPATSDTTTSDTTTSDTTTSSAVPSPT